MKKYWVVFLSVLLMASVATAGGYNQPTPVVNNNTYNVPQASASVNSNVFSPATATSNQTQNQNAYGGNAVAFGGQGGKGGTGGNAAITAPLTNQVVVNPTAAGQPVTQGVTVTNPTPIVQEAGKAAMFYPNLVAPAAPYVAPPGMQTSPVAQAPYGSTSTQGYSAPRTAGSKVTLWRVDGQQYDYADISEQTSPDVEIVGVSISQKNLKATSKPTTLTIRKPGSKLAAVQGQVIWTGVVKAKKPGMIYAQLEQAAMAQAVSVGGSSIEELDRHVWTTNTSKGGGPSLGLAVSALASILGRDGLVGPSIGYTYQSYESDSNVYYYIEYNVVK